MAPDPDDRTLLIAGGVLAALLLVYSVLIAGQLALWFGLVSPLVFLYLFWRLVRAHERLATAMATDDRGGEPHESEAPSEPDA